MRACSIRLATLIALALSLPTASFAENPPPKSAAKPAPKPAAAPATAAATKPAPKPPVAPVAKPAPKTPVVAPAAAPQAAKPPVVVPAAAPQLAKPRVAVSAAPAAPAKTLGLELEIKRIKLENGLRVVLAPDHVSPTIAVDVVYDVGGRNEERGHSGFAHLFEHMMFQGSANVARGEHFKLVTSHGGTLNGTTSEDRTNYFEMLPQSELGLALWLEADRMKSLDITQFNFENQRKVVQEEYRMRVANQPYVPSEIRLQEMVFEGYWPYEHSAIGTMADLDAAQFEWVKAFHDAYYAPNNAVVSIAGDFEEAEAMALVTRFFGDAKALPSLPKYEPGAMPEQTKARDKVEVDEHAKLEAVIEAWAIPAAREKEHYPLDLAAMLLSDGDSSRLYRSLVREHAWCVDVSAETSDHRGPDSFEISAKVSSGAKLADVEKAIDAELSRIAQSGPTDAEMQKLKTRLETHFLMSLQTNIGRAQKLAEFELYWGDATLLKGELARYQAVTRDDIKRAVARYLVPARRSRIEIKPKQETRAAEVAPAKAPPKAPSK
jgi:hypothetical protein